jgi:mRNA-degrading endonuclease RelE of RelBE toxin-antitoxin system
VELRVPAYRLLYHPLVLSHNIPRLDPQTQKRIRVAIERKLTKHPEASAKPLAHTTQRLWSLRVGDWRVNFALREKEVWILKIGHRRDVYSERAYREPPDNQSVSEPDQDSSRD